MKHWKLITGKKYLVTKMNRYDKYQTKQCTHPTTHTTLHTKQIMASAWLGDHQGRPSAPTNSLHKLHMARYQVLRTYLFTVIVLLNELYEYTYKLVV